MMRRELMGVTVERNVAASMRDGRTLFADVYRPDGKGPWPVLLMRNPYDKEEAESLTYNHHPGKCVGDTWSPFRTRAVAGRRMVTSYPFMHEIDDGHDSVE